MGSIFSVFEILSIGIEIEKNGKDFYETAIKYVKSEKVINIFKFLSSQEDEHIKTFQKMINDVEKYEPSESYEGEYMEYIRALAEQHVFTKKNEGIKFAENIQDESEAIKLAINFEKDSVLFYNEMKKFIPDLDNNLINKIIQEEQQHIIKLINIIKA